MEKEENETGMKNEKTVFKRWAQNLGLLFGSIIAFFFLLEIGVRFFDPQNVLELKGLYRRDPVLSMRLVANYRGRDRNFEYSTLVRTNSLGLRDREYPKNYKADFRILVLGDSFTFGIGVNLEDTYVKLLEKRLKEIYPDKRCEVINCGVPSVGTDYEYMFLKEMGNRFRPDVVLVGFFTGNDVSDTLIGYDRYEIKDGLLIWKEEALWRFFDTPWIKKQQKQVSDSRAEIRRAKALREAKKGRLERFVDNVLKDFNWILKRLKRFLRSNSHAYLFLWHRYNWTGEKLFTAGLSPVDAKVKFVNVLHLFSYETYLLKEYPSEVEQGWVLTESYLKKIDKMTKSWGGKSMIVVIPQPIQVYPELLWRMNKRFEIDPNQFDLEKPEKILKNFGLQNGIPVCDLLPAFREEDRKEKLYYRYNTHWNKAGHSLAARLIYEKLKAEGMVP